MGGIITALASFSVETENDAKQTSGSSPVTKRTTEAIQLMLLPISIGMVAYALFTFYWRSRCMERKQASHPENACKLGHPWKQSATCSVIPLYHKISVSHCCFEKVPMHPLAVTYE